MSSIVKKAAGAAFAALTFGLAITATATPSTAQGWRGGGGWHGGGYWRGGRWYGGWGGPFAAGVIGGLAVGALAGAAYPYGPYPYGPYPYGPYYGRGCYMQNQPAYDAWGNFVGYQAVQACY